MITIKKLAVIFLAAVLFLGSAGCDGNKKSKKTMTVFDNMINETFRMQEKIDSGCNVYNTKLNYNAVYEKFVANDLKKYYYMNSESLKPDVFKYDNWLVTHFVVDIDNDGIDNLVAVIGGIVFKLVVFQLNDGTVEYYDTIEFERNFGSGCIDFDCLLESGGKIYRFHYYMNRIEKGYDRIYMRERTVTINEKGKERVVYKMEYNGYENCFYLNGEKTDVNVIEMDLESLMGEINTIFDMRRYMQWGTVDV